jgi:hypothetical protein
VFAEKKALLETIVRLCTQGGPTGKLLGNIENLFCSKLTRLLPTEGQSEGDRFFI